MTVPAIKLNNGMEIPALGLGEIPLITVDAVLLTRISPFYPGTWQSKAEEVITAVCYALKDAGYRHIDCAW